MNYYDLFSKHLSKVKRSSGGNYIALCPFHNDRNPSFSFNEDTGLWQCFACGEKGNAWQFAEKMRDDEWLQKLKKEFKKQNGIPEDIPEDIPKKRKKEKEEKKEDKEKEIVNIITYQYCNKDGKHIYDKQRIEFVDGSKTFKIDWKVQNESEKKLLLYDLSVLNNIDASDISDIWFCEGEKCRDALLIATENREDILIFAYSQNPSKEIENSQIDDLLLNKKITIFADNDEVGEKKANQILEYCKKFAHQIDIVRFQGFEKGYDIADFLEENNIEDALLLAKTEYTNDRVIITSLKDFQLQKIPEIGKLDDIFNIPKGVVGLIAGVGSVGKGYWSLWNIIRWAKEYKIVYLSLEDSLHVIQKRLQKLVRKRLKYDDLSKHKEIILDTAQSLKELNINELLSLLDLYLKLQAEIIIIDPVSALFENESDNSEASKLMFNLNKIASENDINIFLVHHLRKHKNEIVKNKFDMLELIRGASALHSNSRFIWFLRRAQHDMNVIEVFQAKNSYFPSNRDVAVIGLMNDEDITLTKIEIVDNKLEYNKFYTFREFEEQAEEIFTEQKKNNLQEKQEKSLFNSNNTSDNDENTDDIPF